MTTNPYIKDGPVAVVIQQSIAEEGFAAFVRWSGKVGERLKSWPGFQSQEVVLPQPPSYLDWTLILHFTTVRDARAWLQSEVRDALIAEVRSYFVGPEDIHILPNAGGSHHENAVSAIVFFQVPAGLEDAFLSWQQRIQAAEATFDGFLRHKIERPIAGLHDDWIIILSFDSDAHLSVWLDSPTRKALLKEGEQFNASMSVKRANSGFNFGAVVD